MTIINPGVAEVESQTPFTQTTHYLQQLTQALMTMQITFALVNGSEARIHLVMGILSSLRHLLVRVSYS